MPRAAGQPPISSTTIASDSPAWSTEDQVIGEFAEAWRRFEERPTTRPSLAAARSQASSASDYLIYLVALDHERAVARAARHLQACLDFPYVMRVPREALHITMQAVDYRGNLTPEQQIALVDRAAPVFAGLTPFDVTIGGANSFDAAAFLEVHDGGAFREARARLRSELPWLTAEGRDPLFRDGVDTYLPHVSVAYYNAETDARGVVSALARFRDEVVATVRISEVKLVAVRLPLPSADVRYRIESRFALGGGTSN